MQNQIVQQVVETLRGANNVLITVKKDPSVDELTASIGLTLLLNHMNKHATTVFSGKVPSTIEFLQPEMAIETNTDSLRDFIIALDKAKADKLRYKVEDNVVRIFITPYRSSISEDDLDFSQGDFNVDVVVALGVLTKEDFDEALLAHGQILHDATVIAINNASVPNEVGAISWQDQQASSISEMLAGISDLFGPELIDGQIATALMTGIVAETDRFKNEKTTSQVLSVSSMLMSAGANQQLIAEQLEQPEKLEPMQPLGENLDIPGQDGELSVPHEMSESPQEIDIDDNGNLNLPAQPVAQQDHLPLQDMLKEDDAGDVSGGGGSFGDDDSQHDDILNDNDSFGSQQGSPDNEDVGQPSDEDNSQNKEPGRMTADRMFTASPMNANDVGAQEGPAAEEPSGLFKNSLHLRGSREEAAPDDSGTLSRKPKVIQPTMDAPDDSPIDIPSTSTEGKDLEALLNTGTPEQGNDLKASGSNDQLPQISTDHGAPIGDSAASQFVDLPSDPSVPQPAVAEPSQNDRSGNSSGSVVDSVDLPDSPKTLLDIEKVVGSPHIALSGEIEKAQDNINDFLGGTKPAESGIAEKLANLPPLPDIPGGAPNKSAEAIEPPQESTAAVENPSAAPAVPPPLMPMPQAGGSSQPMFFEADGSKSNPFTSK